MSADSTLSGKVVTLIITVGILAAGLGFWASTQFKAPQVDIQGFVYPVPQLITPFTLTDHKGDEFSLARFQKKWTIVFFGYTHCPDICPNTLTLLNQFDKALTKQGDRDNTEVLFISVDPERDTTAQLASYMPYFNDRFVGASGTPEELASISKSLSAVSYIGDKDAEGKYDVDHSAAILLIDPLGRLRARFSPPLELKSLLSDFRQIRSKYREECCTFPDPDGPKWTIVG